MGGELSSHTFWETWTNSQHTQKLGVRNFGKWPSSTIESCKTEIQLFIVAQWPWMIQCHYSDGLSPSSLPSPSNFQNTNLFSSRKNLLTKRFTVHFSWQKYRVSPANLGIMANFQVNSSQFTMISSPISIDCFSAGDFPISKLVCTGLLGGTFERQGHLPFVFSHKPRRKS